MGWLYNTKRGGLKELMARRSEGWEAVRESNGNTVKVTVLARCFRGQPISHGTLWKVQEYTETTPGGSEVRKYRYIAADLLQCHNGCWGYKDLTEGDGPTAVDCPLSYLTIAPLSEHAGPHAAAWRARVTAYHTNKPLPGDWYTLKQNNLRIARAKVVKTRPLTMITAAGVEFRCTRDALDTKEAEPAVAL